MGSRTQLHAAARCAAAAPPQHDALHGARRCAAAAPHDDVRRRPRPRRAALLRALLLAACLLLCFPPAHAAAQQQQQQQKHKLRVCKRSAVSRALADPGAVSWVRRASHDEPRYAHCRAVTARYNCTRFTTSAGDYRLDWAPGAAGAAAAAAAACALPSWATVLAALRARPLRLMLLGDSHAQQIYQAALCMFQAQARHVIAYTHGTAPHVYERMSKMPECHAVRYSDYPRFFLDAAEDEASAAAGGGCSLNHKAETPSCFEIPLTPAAAAAQSGSGLAFSRVCSAYVRPLEGAAAVAAGLDTGLASLGLALSDFDVVGANTYISAKALGAFLAERAFRGRVVAFPKFDFAAQTGLRLTRAALSGALDSSQERAAKKFRVAKFCAGIVAARGGGECTTVQFGRLMLQRSGDSKASIYPMWYADAASGATKVCHADQNEATAHPERCAARQEAVFACVAPPCASESHFCLPGPPDDFALLVLASAV
jgi:hypothetical protein